MRIFVGYGYNSRDRWIEEYVFPLLEALGCAVIHGKQIYGGALPEEVSRLIRTSDAMIGFTTRREPEAEGKYRTHDWVVQELTMAHQSDPRIPWVEVREEGVISPGGVVESADMQRIPFRQQDRAQCLVRIAQAIKRFRDLTSVTLIRLVPADAVEQISPLLDDPSFSCECHTLAGAVQRPARPVPVLPIKGGLFVQLRGIAPGELVRITVSAAGRKWRSDYESVDTVDVRLKE